MTGTAGSAVFEAFFRAIGETHRVCMGCRELLDADEGCGECRGAPRERLDGAAARAAFIDAVLPPLGPWHRLGWPFARAARPVSERIGLGADRPGERGVVVAAGDGAQRFPESKIVARQFAVVMAFAARTPPRRVLARHGVTRGLVVELAGGRRVELAAGGVRLEQRAAGNTMRIIRSVDACWRARQHQLDELRIVIGQRVEIVGDPSARRPIVRSLPWATG